MEFKSSLFVLFIDFEKVLDKVNREYIWNALHKRGIPEKLKAITRAIYNGAKFEVSEEFKAQNSVRQGYILSPILFFFAMLNAV